MQGQGGPRLLGRRGMLVTTLCWRLQVQPLCHSSIGGSCHHLSSTCSTGNQQGSRHLLTRDRHHDDASPAMRTHGSCGTVSGDSYSSGFTLSCRTASGPTSCSSSWLSGGCLCRLCGSTTVRSSGFSARSAPRMTAALVPVAPDVKMWLPYARNPSVIISNVCGRSMAWAQVTQWRAGGGCDVLISGPRAWVRLPPTAVDSTLSTDVCSPPKVAK